MGNQELKAKLEGSDNKIAKRLLGCADYLVKKSVWIFGGDGWAYDIGYGGLDHVLASGENVNVMILDTEVYSNTGGQQSKASPMGAVAKFSMAGKELPKKDLGLIAASYGSVYVARVSIGAKDSHTVSVFREAESYEGPSLIIAYSHCIAHGIAMDSAIDGCKEAVASGHWPLFRYDPRLSAEGKNPLQLDSKDPSISFEDYALKQNRYKVLKKINPEVAETMMVEANLLTANKYDMYKKLAAMQFGDDK
jgi:pyruvate-ferredoxin/flavodoxin oxidoreductase